MVSVYTAHQIHHSKNLKRSRRSGEYKDIFHPDHRPATIGMFGFIIAFGFFSLQLALAPFHWTRFQSVSSTKVAEQLAVVADPDDPIQTCNDLGGDLNDGACQMPLGRECGVNHPLFPLTCQPGAACDMSSADPAVGDAGGICLSAMPTQRFDLNGDGQVDMGDVKTFISLYLTGPAVLDFNADSRVNALDYALFKHAIRQILGWGSNGIGEACQWNQECQSGYCELASTGSAGGPVYGVCADSIPVCQLACPPGTHLDPPCQCVSDTGSTPSCGNNICEADEYVLCPSGSQCIWAGSCPEDCQRGQYCRSDATCGDGLVCNMQIGTAWTGNTPVQNPDFGQCLRPGDLPPVPSVDPTTREQEGCRIGGCNGEICFDGTIVTDPFSTVCAWRDEYACYEGATCQRNARGTCSWQPEKDVLDCVDRVRTTGGGVGGGY